jgi:SAM-dependent methyltransferase
LAQAEFEVEFIEATADEIPLDDSSADTVLVTYTLCSISKILPALGEMRRVLKPDGRLIFCEHGAAPDEGVRRWQNRLNPIWKRVGGGCNLNLPIPSVLERAGFKIRAMDTMYIPGWKPVSFNYWGTAISC